MARGLQINLAVLLYGLFKFTPQTNCNNLLIIKEEKCRVHSSVVVVYLQKMMLKSKTQNNRTNGEVIILLKSRHLSALFP